jgi:hypothetical protein
MSLTLKCCEIPPLATKWRYRLPIGDDGSRNMALCQRKVGKLGPPRGPLCGDDSQQAAPRTATGAQSVPAPFLFFSRQETPRHSTTQQSHHKNQAAAANDTNDMDGSGMTEWNKACLPCRLVHSTCNGYLSFFSPPPPPASLFPLEIEVSRHQSCAHLFPCSDRPCKRCCALGRPDQCVNVERKKRGRPRKNPIEGEELLEKRARIEGAHTFPPYLTIYFLIYLK